MTEPGPFTPPSGAVPPAPALPPPTGQPIGATSPAVPSYPAVPTYPTVPPPPPPPARRPWLISVIVVGALAFVGLVVGVAVVAINLASSIAQGPISAPDSAPDPAPIGELDDLLEGDPGSPVAVDPLDCGACFGIEDARALGLPAAAYSDVGLSNTDDEVFETSAGADQIDQTKWWKADGGTPDSCYFTYPMAPLFLAPGSPGDPTAEADRVYYPEWHHDDSEYYYFTEGIRVFGDSDAATTYLAELESAIAGCPDYSYSDSGWFSVVTATPALELPDSVAAYGWAESGGLNRFYGVDLQRGNLVVRLTLTSDPGGPTEAEFRELVEAYAVLLEELEPAG
jgi:hypothetical protein